MIQIGWRALSSLRTTQRVFYEKNCKYKNRNILSFSLKIIKLYLNRIHVVLKFFRFIDAQMTMPM
jgi:hypothetical protein